MEEIKRLNDELSALSAVDRVRHTIDFAKSQNMKVVQTTSFGIQSAMMIKLLALAGGIADVPIIFIDTGYLPAETYQFAEQMKIQYGLNLHIYQSEISPARMEATFGKLWDDESHDAHRQYNTIRKVIPMEDALTDLRANIVLTGLRSSQTAHRQNLSYVNVDGDRWKICPLLDWDEAAVQDFFMAEQLPYHPLFHRGYRTVGDWHSSAPYDPSVHKSVRDSRFHGRTQECGLHVSISNISFTASSTVPASEASLTLTNESSSLGSDSEDGFVIYGRPNCKYCRAAKKLLHSIQKEVDPDVTINEVHVGKDITKEELLHRLGDDIQTVPQILYKGHHIGGYDDLCSWGVTQYEEDRFLQLSTAITVE